MKSLCNSWGWRWLLILVASLILLPFPAGEANCQTVNPVIAKTIADWQKRYDRAKAVRYAVQGTHVIPNGSLLDDAGVPVKTEGGVRDVTCTLKRSLLLDLAGNRHRLEIDDEIFSFSHRAIIKRYSTSAFDGREFKGTQRQVPPNPTPLNTPPLADMSIATGNLKYAAFQPKHWPLLFGHGIVKIYGEPEILPGNLRQEYDPDSLVVHGVSVEDGRACTILRSRTLKGGAVAFAEIVVDPLRDSAIVRYSHFSNNKPTTNTTIRYRDTASGWLPSSWTFSGFGAGKLLIREEMTVANIELDPSIAKTDFDIEMEPGMLVSKTAYGAPIDSLSPLPTTKEEYYRVNNRGGLDRVSFSGAHEQAASSAVWWYLAAAAGIVILGARIFLRRRSSAVAM